MAPDRKFNLLPKAGYKIAVASWENVHKWQLSFSGHFGTPIYLIRLFYAITSNFVGHFGHPPLHTYSKIGRPLWTFPWEKGVISFHFSRLFPLPDTDIFAVADIFDKLLYHNTASQNFKNERSICLCNLRIRKYQLSKKFW